MGKRKSTLALHFLIRARVPSNSEFAVPYKTYYCLFELFVKFPFFTDSCRHRDFRARLTFVVMSPYRRR